MKKKLVIDIECGELTCASEPGKFCSYFGSRKFGQVPVCLLFSSNGDLDEKGGWTLRCADCLKHQK